ncbi:hypothetical protein [Streptomyces sp. AN091965]|uniref:hypothetical protein n=1 Tax=Streptomyces sp. AN091965 TaxID=2927803 RepID=UPI001F616FA4|nr:hypothetical protein [Streptomyces sp. AN091965]MCI3935340.1 hypothetical protein [Streptomyces sp. AN091965]
MILAAEVLDLINATITQLAAPTITASLGSGLSLAQWPGASYASALGVLPVVAGLLYTVPPFLQVGLGYSLPRTAHPAHSRPSTRTRTKKAEPCS